MIPSLAVSITPVPLPAPLSVIPPVARSVSVVPAVSALLTVSPPFESISTAPAPATPYGGIRAAAAGRGELPAELPTVGAPSKVIPLPACGWPQSLDK